MIESKLSKSQYLRGLQCHKKLWLYRNRKDLLEEPDAAQQALFDTGTDVGLLAQQLFPGGEEIRFEEGNFDDKIQRTKDLIESGVKTIYEATFKYDGVLVMVDILHKGRSGWQLYEVKSSTQVKDVHYDDVAVQYYVLNGSGLNIAKTALVHINSQYVREGELDIKQLFAIEDLTESVLEQQDEVVETLELIRVSVQGEEPDIDIGPHCSDPYECDFTDYCWKHIPEVSIFNLSRLRGSKKWELYNQGIIEFNDLPDDYPLNSAQEKQVEAHLNGTEFLDKPEIEKFLKTLSYPLYFLDFETYQSAIPQFDGLRPYVQIPFQYSLHFQINENGKLEHKEFLAMEGEDPRESLVKKLVEDIPRDVCVLAYNMGFEKGVIRNLAEQFPNYADHLMDIHDNMLDLMAPFRSKDIYLKEMKGSYSIKYVLPALVPGLSYQDLKIKEGGQASSTYATLHLIEDEKEREEIRQNLLAYCKLDTLAMVKILKFLQSTVFPR